MRGFSLVEMVVAIGLTLAVLGAVFTMLDPVHGAFATEPEKADMHQRLRVAADAIGRHLIAAGAGSNLHTPNAPVAHAFASVLPFRQGGSADDTPGVYRADTITIISVPATAAQTTLAADLMPGDLTVRLAPESTCAPGTNLCDFKEDLMLLVFDDTGNYDLFEVAAVADAASEVTLASRPADSAATTYRAGSRVVEARVDTYYLKTAVASQVTQLMHSDGTTNGDAPVVDHVVGLSFEYYGEPAPPALVGRRATYGPAPPDFAVAPTAYPAGENCTFTADGETRVYFPRLGALNATGTLVKLTAAQLTDGPWCPDVFNANRWDADLLRIRKVAATIRVQSADAALRGPAGALFANPGTSRGGARWAADQEIRLEITPRNLNGGR
jgi:Tfp pilus assembly protein PilW